MGAPLGQPLVMDRLAGELRTVVNRLTYALRSPAVGAGITPTRLTALMMLVKFGPMRPSDMAARLNITAASMSSLVEILTDGGWVSRKPDPDDRRASLISLSAAGEKMIEKLRRDGAGELAAEIKALPAQQQEALGAALPALVALADHLLDSTT